LRGSSKRSECCCRHIRDQASNNCSAGQLLVESQHETAAADLVEHRAVVRPEKGTQVSHRRPRGRVEQVSDLGPPSLCRPRISERVLPESD
jgi:hypothetical protein